MILPRLLVFGQTGQVARELQRAAPQALFLDRRQADLSAPDSCSAAIDRHAPQVVINAAAYTAVDRAETEEALANAVNAAAPASMARTCAAHGIPLLHVSTDYVFDGSGTAPRGTEDSPAPLNAYGRSKLAGEEAIRAAGGVHAILRTSWVFSAHGANFVKTMLRLSESRDRLSIVADQVGGPTPAADIASTLLAMAGALHRGQTGGTYHYAGEPAVSWACFARETFARAGRDVTVEQIPTADYPTPAARPLNSRLDCSKLATEFGITPPDWRAGLSAVIEELQT